MSSNPTIGRRVLPNRKESRRINLEQAPPLFWPQIVARNPSQATTLSPSGGLTILSNEVGHPDDWRLGFFDYNGSGLEVHSSLLNVVLHG